MSNTEWSATLPVSKEDLLRPAIEWAGREPDCTIPSYALGQDGRSIASVFCLFGEFICEVKVSSGGAIKFDFARLTSSRCLQVEQEEVLIGDGANTERLTTLTITVKHSELMESRISHVGEGRLEWLREVRSALGLSKVIGFK
jgi:hypothetical protein